VVGIKQRGLSGAAGDRDQGRSCHAWFSAGVVSADGAARTNGRDTNYEAGPVEGVSLECLNAAR
jgi:hypothetical protein